MPEFISILRWIRDVVYPKAVELENTISNLPDQITGGYSQSYIDNLKDELTEKIEVIGNTTFDNIAQLRLNSNIGKVDILGYYTKGDGGGGTFYWDSNSLEEDDGGYVIQATEVTTGRWKRVINGVTRKCHYGIMDFADTIGTEVENDSYTGNNGEITVDITNDIIRVHDNVTVGGHRIAKDNNYVVRGNSFLSKVKINQATNSSLFGVKKGISILGDSITHGAFALNSFKHSWARLFQKMANLELESESYGVINFLSLGSGGTATTDIHSVNFIGSWSSGANSLKTLIGLTLHNAAVGDEININIPSFQNNGLINYVTQPSGGQFELYVNSILISTIDTNGTLDCFSTYGFPLSDNKKGSCDIKIKVISGTVEISTIRYYIGTSAEVSLFANSGRKLRELDNLVIEKVCENSSCLIMALGHNDIYNTELVAKIDKLILECNNNKISLVIPDFRWNSPTTDLVRKELVRLHRSVKGSIYIPFPDLFKNNGETVDGAYAVTTLSLFTDASHPNKMGHKIIAETIAKELNFSCSSKEDANSIYEYKLPLTLNPSTTVENIGSVSSVKIDKNTISITMLIRMASSGAFPVGPHIIQTAWNSKYEMPLIRQSFQGVGYIRNDTGAIVSVVSLNSSGQITLNVITAFITNQQLEFNVCIN